MIIRDTWQKSQECIREHLTEHDKSTEPNHSQKVKSNNDYIFLTKPPNLDPPILGGEKNETEESRK